MAQFNHLNVQGTIRLLRGASGSNIHTSFSPKETCNGSHSMGAIQSGIGDVLGIIKVFKNTNGGSGSFSHNSETVSGVTIPSGWFCCIWIPDTKYSPDSKNYGNLIMTGMTVDGFYIVRYASGSIASVHKWY